MELLWTSIAAGPWGFWATMALFGLIMGFFYGINMVVGVVYGIVLAVINPKMDFCDPEFLKQFSSNGLLLAIGTTLSARVCTGIAVLFAWLRKSLPLRDYLALRKPERRQWPRWIIILGLFMVLSDGLTHLLGRPIVPDFMVEAYRTAGFTPLLWFVLLVMAPLFEETTFRGFFFQGLLRSPLGSVGAVAISALGWAVIHSQYDLYEMATVFAIGLMLGIARLLSGSIYLTMAMHSLMNLVATVQVVIFLRFFQ